MFRRVALLVIAELVMFAWHTITQLLMGVGLTEVDWSSWYRLFSHARFPYDEACAVKVAGPFLRKGAPHCPLFLIVVRGKNNKRTRRQPLPFLVNAVLNDAGQWALPLPTANLTIATFPILLRMCLIRQLKPAGCDICPRLI